MKSKKAKRLLALACAALMVTSTVQTPMAANAAETKAETSAEKELKLRYDEPAGITSYSDWEKWSLPIGNSGIGASVFGGVTRERIQLNEKSLWSGGPSDSRPNYNGGNIESRGQNGAAMKQIQDYFIAGNSTAATNWCNSYLVGVSDDAGTQGYGYYLSYGNMYLDFNYGSSSKYTNYERTLDLRTAVAGVEYDVNDVHYTRENFISYPDNVLVTRITADSPSINVDVAVEPDNQKGGGSNNPSSSSYTREWTTNVKDGLISISGDLDDNQMKFASHTKVIADGKVSDNNVGKKVSVSGASTVTIITSIGTDYKNEYPEYRTGETDDEVSARVLDYVTKASKKDYETLKADHVEDYDNIFGRVELDLGMEVSSKTTDALLNAYKAGTASETEKRYLEVMLFQFGRFLTIESSRETPTDENGNEIETRATLPSNLQGIWVGANNSAWHSDYHMNVNLQMNYWPAYSTNMTECAEPLIAYVDSLREPGRVTAKIYAGIESTEENPENGFMAHTQNNPFGWTCPGWAFSWGWSPAAVPWILQNCWEYYEYTGDLEYMKENIYPMMKEEAVLYDQLLIDEKGKEYVNADGTLVDSDDIVLVSSPSYSPEQGPYTAGNTYEQTLIWQLYEDVITAAELVGETDTDLIEGWKYRQDHLKGPIEIGTDGQIKEWYEETTLNSVAAGATSHRHMSHLLGLFPGDLISFETPELLEAAKVSLANRMDKTTGWGMGQRINSWARVGDGNHAYKLIGDLFDSGIMTNLWDTHPPFQIDGNFGYTSGVAEMLLQSNVGYINLLPALPDAWPAGTVEGLMARGNFEVAMSWEDMNLTEVSVLSNNGEECVIEYPSIADAAVKVTASNGEKVTVKKVSDTRISFPTTEGVTYTLTEIPERPLDAPENGKVVSCIDEAILDFEAVSGAESYNVYVSEDGESFELLKNMKDTMLKLEDHADGKTYKVAAVKTYEDGVEREGLRSKEIVPAELALAQKIDDRDSRIKYSSDWGDWSDGGQYLGTEKYSTASGATAEFYFYGNTVRVIGMKNTDCKTFNFYIDGELVGENVSTTASSCQRQSTLFEKEVEEGLHKATLVVKQSKVSLDAFEFEHSVKASGLKIVGEDVMNLNASDTLTLTASYVPEGTAGAGVTWSVDNTEIATIDENGVLTGLKEGTVVVTATDKENAAMKATFKVSIVRDALEMQKFDSAVLAENAIANSEMNPASGSDGPASWAFDEQNHWWHSRWGNWNQLQDYETVTQAMTGKPSETNPIWIQSGFDRVFYIDHIDYTGRDNNMGVIKTYAVSVANLEDPTATPTDDDFTVVKEGTLEAVTSTQTIQLDEIVAATHIRITATGAYKENDGSAAAGDGHVAAKKLEIYGYVADPTDDGSPFTEAKPYKFPSKLNESNTLEAERMELHNSGENEDWPLEVADGSWASGGKFVNSMNEGDTVVLYYNAPAAGTYEAVVTYRSGDSNNGFSWTEADGKIKEGSVIMGATDAAQGIIHTGKVTFEVVTAGKGKLTFATGSAGAPQLDKFEITMIKEAGAETTPADKAELEAAIEAAKELKEEDYTAESWKAADLANVIKDAEKVVKDEKADQEAVNAAVEALEKAVAKLVEKEETPAPEEKVERLSGATRYETGIAVADELKAVLGVDKFEAAIIATGKSSADALSGSYLAAVKNAPILLTNGKADNVETLHAYIKENVKAGAKVYVLGGTGAVSAEAAAVKGYDVVRLSGSSRYETNLAILKEAGAAGDDLLVATGKDFADSLSASAAARPILLVKPDTALNAEQKALAANFKNIYVIGGTGAVSASVENELKAFGKVTRLSGAGRYETSIAVAETFFTNPESVVLAYGKNFPDGLCGGPLAAALNAPLVLTRGGNEATAAAYVAANGVKSGYVLGGEGVLSNDTVKTVFSLDSFGEAK